MYFSIDEWDTHIDFFLKGDKEPCESEEDGYKLATDYFNLHREDMWPGLYRICIWEELEADEDGDKKYSAYSTKKCLLRKEMIFL